MLCSPVSSQHLFGNWLTSSGMRMRCEGPRGQLVAFQPSGQAFMVMSTDNKSAGVLLPGTVVVVGVV